MKRQTRITTAIGVRATILIALFTFFWTGLFIWACSGERHNSAFDPERFMDSCELKGTNVPKICRTYLASGLSEENKSHVYIQLGRYLEKEGTFDSALVYYQRALAIRNSIDPNSQNTINARAAIAGILASTKEFIQAREEFLKIIPVTKDSLWLANYHNDLGIINFKLGSKDSSSRHFYIAYQIAKRSNDSVAICKRLFNYLLNIRANGTDSISSYLGYFESCNRYLKTKRGYKNYLYLKYLKAVDLGKYEEAKRILVDRLAYTDSIGSTKEKLDAELALANFYYNYKKDYYTSSNMYYDYLNKIEKWYSEEMSRNVSENRVKYETELLEESNANLAEELKFRNILTALLLALMVLGVFTYRNHRKKQKAQVAEALARKDLEIKKIFEGVDQNNMDAWVDGQEAERKRLAQDLHDRLGGLLSLVNLNFENFQSRIEDLKAEGKEAAETMQELIKQAISEVRAISHDISDTKISSMGLAKALDDLASKVNQAKQLEVHLFTKLIGDKIDPKVEIALYRITQEAMNNVIKHAKAKNLHINLLEEDLWLRLTLEDDGIGFNSKTTSEGIGMENMKNRANALGGEFIIESESNIGTTVMVSIPLKKE